MFGGGQRAVKRLSLNFRALITSQAAKPQCRPHASPRRVQLLAPQHQVFILIFGPNSAKQDTNLGSVGKNPVGDEGGATGGW